VTYPGIIANIPAVESAAAGVGIVNTLPEIDGVVRRMPMVVAVTASYTLAWLWKSCVWPQATVPSK
jgi:hypothetical protein